MTHRRATCHTGSFGDDDGPMSPRSPPTHLWTWSCRFTSRLCRKTGRFFVVPGTGQWGDRGSYALDEVDDAVVRSPTLQDLAVGGAGHLLNREVADGVVADRISGHPITLFELSIIVAEGAQDHSVAGPARQQIVDLRPHPVVATYPASRFEVNPLMAGADSVDAADSSITPRNASDTDMIRPPRSRERAR